MELTWREKKPAQLVSVLKREGGRQRGKGGQKMRHGKNAEVESIVILVEEKGNTLTLELVPFRTMEWKTYGKHYLGK